MPSPHVYPVYVFTRRREIETPDRILAGRLSLNNFAQRRLSHRARRELTEIIHGLTEDVQAGHMPDDALVVGWPGDGRKPANAADVADTAAMSSWTERAFTIFVRVDRNGEPTFTRTLAEPLRQR
jgi:hypothetical protein